MERRDMCDSTTQTPPRCACASHKNSTRVNAEELFFCDACGVSRCATCTANDLEYDFWYNCWTCDASACEKCVKTFDLEWFWCIACTQEACSKCSAGFARCVVCLDEVCEKCAKERLEFCPVCCDYVCRACVTSHGHFTVVHS